jgi:hypothetical protein
LFPNFLDCFFSSQAETKSQLLRLTFEKKKLLRFPLQSQSKFPFCLHFRGEI